MGRKNYFEKLEREINLQREYEKIESLVLQSEAFGIPSIENDIERYFINWKYKAYYLSFYEIREQLGFTYGFDGVVAVSYGSIDSINDFFDYCEMIVNMIYIIPEGKRLSHVDNINKIKRLVNYDLNSLNHEIRKIDDKYLIIQKDAAVSEVVDIVKDSLAKIILEYNHYLLKGDLERKKAILLKIAHVLESKKQEIKKINYQLHSDYSYLINNFNIRHNNCDISNTKNYNEKFVKMSDQEKEEWYDEIYQMGLLIFLLLENKEKSTKIVNIKDIQRNAKK